MVPRFTDGSPTCDRRAPASPGDAASEVGALKVPPQLDTVLDTADRGKDRPGVRDAALGQCCSEICTDAAARGPLSPRAPGCSTWDGFEPTVHCCGDTPADGTQCPPVSGCRFPAVSASQLSAGNTRWYGPADSSGNTSPSNRVAAQIAAWVVSHTEADQPVAGKPAVPKAAGTEPVPWAAEASAAQEVLQ